MSYVNDGLVLFAFIARVGQKYRNIQHDPRLSVAIAGEFTHANEIQGLSIAARAEFVSDKRDFDQVWDSFLKRHPEFNSIGRPNPAMAPLIRMVPEWISVVDYTNLFGRSELTKVSPPDLRPELALSAEESAMVESELIGDGVLKVIAPRKLQSGDFAELAREVEPLVRQTGRLRVIIDATQLQGSKNMSAIEEHAAFVKSHQKDVDRIAIIAGHEWQHWLVGALKVFLHPEIRIFDAEIEALNSFKG